MCWRSTEYHTRACGMFRRRMHLVYRLLIDYKLSIGQELSIWSSLSIVSIPIVGSTIQAGIAENN